MVLQVGQQVKEGMLSTLNKNSGDQDLKGKCKRDINQEDCHKVNGLGQFSWKCPKEKVNNNVKPDKFQMGHVTMDTGARIMTHPYHPKSPPNAAIHVKKMDIYLGIVPTRNLDLQSM